MNALQKKRLNWLIRLLVLAVLVIGLSLYALKQNINLFFGEVNHLEYTQTMMKFPSLFKVDREVKKYLKEKNRNISIEAS